MNRKFVNAALRTLRRIPDDVVLAMATVKYTMGEGACCVVGWAVRQDLLAATGEDDAWMFGAIPRAVERFGGTYDEWNDIFSGVCYDETRKAHMSLPEIELAFVQRIDEAVRA